MDYYVRVSTRETAQKFEEACIASHSKCATTGYKWLTLTVPKEVSRFPEGHRDEAKAAIHAAVRTALDCRHRSGEGT